MAIPVTVPLLDHFAALKDPRQNGKILYPLPEILLLVLSATLAGGMTMATAAIVLVLKPILTAVFLRAGARGGMLTPALATGAAAGTLLVLIINAVAGTQYHVPAVSMAGAAGVLAITQRAPFWAAIFVWELARPPLWLLLVFLVAALSAYGLLRLVERGRARARVASP